MDVRIEPSWHAALYEEFSQPYFTQLIEFVRHEYSTQTIYPNGSQLFRAFDQTPLHACRVVILGQDPYHQPGQAEGLCFSVPDNIPAPPSLRNIRQELHADLGDKVHLKGNSLIEWAEQGVLLLNTTLTVRHNHAASHAGHGWEIFTDAVIRTISKNCQSVVFILWGSHAQKKTNLIDTSRHHIITSAHPSPLSAYRGFFGSKPFSKTNQYLLQKGSSPIEW